MANVERLLIDVLLLAQPSNYSEALATPATPAPPRHVRQAIDLLEGHPERSWTPTEIAAAVSVSVRYLQEGFQRSAGVSPMTYLGELRLARVHGELTRATSESETVTQVATRWGFVHLGRFSAACGRKYGRRPSDTLRDLSAN